MKRTVKLLILYLLSTTITSSCIEIEKYEDGRISYDEIFQNDKKTAAYLNLCYSNLGTYGMGYGENTLLAGFSDEAYDANDILNGRAFQWHDGRLTPYANPIDNGLWNNYWTGIRYCNVFLANINDAQISIETNRNSWRAQAYTLRAYYYLQLIKRFGGVPIITEPVETGFDYSKVRKSTFSECARQIFSDCKNALEAKDNELGWRSGNAENDRGKMTKAVVHAIMSQTALYAASPLWNDGNITWKEAAKICLNALNECKKHGYDLFKSQPAPNAGYSPYDMYFYSRSDINGATDKETIYECRNRMSIYRFATAPMNDAAEKAGACPSQELVDAYETIDGIVPILGYKDKEHLQPIINPDAKKYNESKPYENRDPRLKASIYYNGSLYALNNPNSTIYTYKNGNCALSKTNIRNTRTGYYVRKFLNFTSNKSINNDGYFKIFRLGELYLNAAEALNEASTSGEAPTEAINAINEVRSRVQMPKIKAMSQEEFRKRIRNERRIELAFEEHRFYDVRRWKILSETDQIVTGMSCSLQNGQYKYKRIIVDDNRKAWEDKFLVFPIPGDEVIKLKNLTGIDFQNPGWK